MNRADTAEKIRRIWRGTLHHAEHKLPPGTRVLAGVLLMVCGVFGFLPVIGFWMFPLGVAVAALDIRPVWRKFFGPGHVPPPRSLETPPTDEEVREREVERPKKLETPDK